MLNIEIFKEAFNGLCELYDKEPSKPLVKLYYQALRGMTDDEFKRACTNIVSMRVYNSLPKPAEFLEMIYGSQEDRALLAFDKAAKAARQHGAYVSVVFDDPIIHSVISRFDKGWVDFCHLNEDDLKWNQKEFIAAYNAYSKNVTQDFPRLLSGITEQHNAIRQEYREKLKVPVRIKTTDPLSENPHEEFVETLPVPTDEQLDDMVYPSVSGPSMLKIENVDIVYVGDPEKCEKILNGDLTYGAIEG